MNTLTVDRELKIRNAASLWKQVRETEDPLELDCSGLEKIDGAGMQLLLYLIHQEYKLKGLTEDLIRMIDNKGYTIKGDKS
ncbi:STAS domain-containing protein [Spirochaeta isovalerica]|uniref:ABC-type transporter Mla MlaB component n=1 Tax=Spirochaeta isovalerica TaxID=150 RepID=A0A841RCR8_9SPIO|nr:STAS domain-containing protein [Spirochaeta isovalerica]MBB6480192.1 ABC-type transporter Mla MlaB component [Spirochaeta isovalerica]